MKRVLKKSRGNGEHRHPCVQAIINYARIKNKLLYELSAKYNVSGFIVRRGYFWQDDFLRVKDRKIMHKPRFPYCQNA